MGPTASLPPGAPIVVMLHGHRFSTERVETSPHRHIPSLDPDFRARRAVSWPSALGFTAGGDEGLAIALGCSALGRSRQAHARASRLGADLAGLIDRLALAAQWTVAMIGQSLEALSALPRATPGAVGTLDGLRALDFPITQGASRACHWSPCLRRGLFDVWRRTLCTPAELPLAPLARCRPEQPLRRWSQLLAPPFAARASQPTPGPLSFGAESA